MGPPAYQRRRPVDASWVREIPEHWRTLPLKFVVTLRSGGTPSKENLAYWDGDVPWASAKDLKAPYLRDTEDHIAQKAVDDGVSTLVEIGSVLIVVRGMILAHTFPVSEVRRPMAINQDLKAVTARPPLRQEFVPWLLRGISQITLAQVDEAGHGTKVIRLDRWLSTIVPVPSGEEQVAIAAFLDNETTKIDTLVAEQRRLIELLKEKRQAVISHAVTKGLNPDAPMKRSGIGWIGDVPAHWRVVRLGRYATVENGSTPSRDDPALWDGDIPWVSSGEVNQERIAEATALITKEALETCSLRLLPKDTVVVGMVGQGKTRGMAALLEIEAAINQNLGALIPSSGLRPLYLLHCFEAMYEQLREFGRGGNQAALNCDILAAIRIPLPPIDEQLKIVEHIEEDLTVSSTLTLAAQQAIELLLERRTALISAAVTGQIDVRGVAPSEAA